MDDASAFIAVIMDIFRRFDQYIGIDARLCQSPPATARQSQTLFLTDVILQYHEHIVVAVGAHGAAHPRTEQQNLLRPGNFFNDLRD